MSGDNLDKGTTVTAVTSAGSVTEFTISQPAVAAESNKKLTFKTAISKDYHVESSTTKYKGDTSELSFRVGDTDSVTGTKTVGTESLFRCVAYDSAGASQTSNMFYINISVDR